MGWVDMEAILSLAECDNCGRRTLEKHRGKRDIRAIGGTFRQTYGEVTCYKSAGNAEKYAKHWGQKTRTPTAAPGGGAPAQNAYGATSSGAMGSGTSSSGAAAADFRVLQAQVKELQNQMHDLTTRLERLESGRSAVIPAGLSDVAL